MKKKVGWQKKIDKELRKMSGVELVMSLNTIYYDVFVSKGNWTTNLVAEYKRERVELELEKRLLIGELKYCK